MALHSGTRIGSYDITAPLGAGGPPPLAYDKYASCGASTEARETKV